MLCAYKIDNTKVVGSDVEKKEGPFHCPVCRNDVILKKGNIYIHHFAHKTEQGCHYGIGESEKHRRTKLEIFNELKANGFECELEKRLVGEDGSANIADVWAVINGQPIAIEVQISNLSLLEIENRTRSYYKKGIAVLWLVLDKNTDGESKIALKSYGKWIHAAYFGRVYYYSEKTFVRPIHFGPFRRWVESAEWYTPDGELQMSGGYYRDLKRYRTPLYGKKVNIISDFRPVKKDRFSSKTIYIPECLLYIDNQLSWWKPR